MVLSRSSGRETRRAARTRGLSTELSPITRRPPFGPASLIDADLTVDFAKETTPRDIVTVIATQPLTRHEPWVRMDRGSLVVFHDGLPGTN